MWRDARLAFSDPVTVINCSIVAAHPWVYGLGQQTENGAYLSPVNAISYLAEKLAATGGTADVVIMMVAGHTHDNFMNSLNQLVDVFPSSEFSQVKRLAQSAAELALEKMQIPAKYAAGLTDVLPLSIPTSRTALAAAAVKKAQEEAAAAVDIGSLKQQLDDFNRLRDSLLGDIAGSLEALRAKAPEFGYLLPAVMWLPHYWIWLKASRCNQRFTLRR